MTGIPSDNPKSGGRPRYDSFTGPRDSNPPVKVDIPPEGPSIRRPGFNETKVRTDISGQQGEGTDISGQQPDERRESLGRPSRDQINAQEKSLKDAVTELRTASAELRELLEHAESSVGEIEREGFQRFIESIELLCAYLEDKRSILVDVDTNEQDRIHIAVVVNFYLENAARSSRDLKGLHLDETKAKGKIDILQQLLRRVAERFGVMLSGLLTPKEWTLKGEFSMNIIGKAGVSVEIKFGR